MQSVAQFYIVDNVCVTWIALKSEVVCDEEKPLQECVQDF